MGRLPLILFIAALVLFILAAVSAPDRRLGIIAAGLACALAAFLLKIGVF
jgi:hypothetical protein